MALDPSNANPIAPQTPGINPAPTPPNGQPAANQVPPAPNGPIPTSDPNNPPIQPAPVNYYDGADDELKAFIGDKKPLDLAKELKGAQALIGKKQVGIPNEASTPEEHKAFHKARGVPEAADGYKFDDVLAEITKDLPADLVALDPEREKRFREFAKASNLSNGEARELIKRELSHEIEGRKAQVQQTRELAQKTSDLVTQTWGTKKEEYAQDANTFFRHVGIDGDALEIANSALGSKPEARMKFLDFARQQGMLLREGGQMSGAQPGAVVAQMSPDQARVAKQEYLRQADNHDAYMNPQHKNHASVTAQMTQYLKAERGIK